LAIAIGGDADSGANILDITQQDIDALGGFIPLTIAANETGNITITNPVTFDSSVSIESPQGAIDVNGAITALGNASINLNSATTTLNASLSTEGQNITIGNSPNPIGNSIWLGNDIELSTGPGEGDIIFNGNVNDIEDDVAFAHALTLSPGIGNVFFNGEVGNLNDLGSLIIGSDTTTSADLIGSSTTVFQTLTVNAQNVTVAGTIRTTEGDITFTGDVILIDNVTLDTGEAGAGNITFGRTVSSLLNDGNPYNLTLIAGTGNITFGGRVGDRSDVGTYDLGAITINSATNVTA
jgi:hypothetical protein